MSEGDPVSRPIKSVMQELAKIEASGVKEIVLTGIRLGAYDYDGTRLPGLIEKILKATSIPRIRLSSIEPTDINDELIDLIAKEGRICRHLHIPLQSGSNKILKLMNRKYSMFDYEALIKKIKKSVEDINITTDIIVGFPSEADEDFQDSVDAVKKMLFGKVHVFSYSVRPKTMAAEMDDKVAKRYN